MAQTILNMDHLFNSIIVKITWIIDINVIQKILAVNAISISLNPYNWLVGVIQGVEDWICDEEEGKFGDIGGDDSCKVLMVFCM